MLARIRRNLTILYTMLFGLFLLAFVGIVYTSIFWGTYVEKTDEIRLLAGQIAREQRSEIVQYYKNGRPASKEIVSEDDYDISGQVFYYIMDLNGKVIKADLPVPVLRDAVLDQVLDWDPATDTHVATVSLPTGEYATLVFAAQKVYSGEKLLATVYVGRDVTAYSRSIKRSVMTIAGTGVLFLLLAALIGYYLSGKVMIPIVRSIARQKQFAADASHELRNPLSVLLTSVEAVERDKDSSLSPFSRQIITDAKDEFLRLKRLINDLLTLARADTGDVKLNKEVFLLESVAAQVIHSLEAVAEQRNISVRLQENGPIEVNADPERIHQLLFILIDNGLKHSSQGSEVSVYIKLVQSGRIHYAEIVVEDNGPGIPPEFQKQIFQRFFRVDEARARDTEGSGLGLSIAQWIVNAHQGEIHVNSEEGKGSRFVVLLPVK
ncbi:MAG: HAMP domain-containing sensor histidine kinase [Negativicutes bacterium]|nr:HAMP domain-containing sensor histidine kinase [Negativicutes bacterium]